MNLTPTETLCACEASLYTCFNAKLFFFSYSFFIHFFAVTSERSKGEIGNHRCFHMSCLITSSFCAAIVFSHVLSRHEFNLAKALYYFTLNNTSKIRWLLLKFVWEQLVWQNFPAFIEKKKLLFLEFVAFFVGFDYFSVRFGCFLTFYPNHKIHDGRSKMTAAQK